MSFIPIATPSIGEREIAYVTDAVRSGWVSSIGAYIERFEAAFAEYVGTRHAIAVSNGTTGLHLALHSLGLGPGDEVLVPDLTFVATAHAVLQTGATPVLVDVEPDTWCIDPQAAAQAISGRTKAILPVHLYGHPADMPAVLALAARHDLLVIEDAAEAHGAALAAAGGASAARGAGRAGGLGACGVFSFYGNKIITTGEGGMITTDDDALAGRLRFLKDHGMSAERRYYHTELAFNYRMTNLQAALGLAQLEGIDGFIAHRRQVFAWYAEGLAGRPGIQLNTERPGAYNVYWMPCVVLDEALPLTAPALADALRRAEIDSRPFFAALHTLPHLQGCRTAGAAGPGCPVATRLAQRGLNLPSGPHVDQGAVARITGAIRAALDGAAPPAPARP